MPTSVGEDRGCAVVVLEGRYAVSEARQAITRSVAPFRDAPARGLVVDLRDSLMLEQRASFELRETAGLLGRLGPAFSFRAAAVVGSDLGFGLMRMVSFWAEEDAVVLQVCRDYEWAVRWTLGGEPAGECEDDPAGEALEP